ncbi:MAG: hypothetical protein V4646_05525 [Pseudomonadota bacterium]
MNIPTSLPELARELRDLLYPSMPSRPFIADGSPFSCDVAIIGINPGTTTPFWDFWSDQTGFNRAQWVETYYTKPGATRNAIRNRIERLVPALRPLRVVELNAFPYATRSEAELTVEMRDSRVLHLMLQVARPHALFIFGKEPARAVASLFGLTPPVLRSVTQWTLDGRNVLVFTEPHLSRGWSYQAVEALAERVKQTLAETV